MVSRAHPAQPLSVALWRGPQPFQKLTANFPYAVFFTYQQGVGAFP
jgi:hypothetical protein